jgi:uncharacterized protein (DUF433 family)
MSAYIVSPEARADLVARTGCACRMAPLRSTEYMSLLADAEKLIEKMSRAEKAQLLQWTARDLGDAYPGVESRPGVCGGEPCIIRTRIPVWVLEQARRLGVSEADLLRNYPTLRAEDLSNAWAYVRSHREEIERQILENEEA